MTTPEVLQPDAMAPPHPEPRGVVGALNELLTRPVSMMQREGMPSRRAPRRLFVGAVLCYILYGLAAGSFAGGSAYLLAAFKVPLVIVATFVLCLPSLFVFGAMAGIEWTWRKLLLLSSGFAGTLGLLLGGMLPIAWLFSVSSRYLLGVIWLHILLWVLALLFGARFLRAALRESGASAGLLPWVVLICLVSFQVATVLRPVLSSEPGEPLFVSRKMSFFENLAHAADLDAKRSAVRTAPPVAPAPDPSH